MKRAEGMKIIFLNAFILSHRKYLYGSAIPYLLEICSIRKLNPRSAINLE